MLTAPKDLKAASGKAADGFAQGTRRDVGYSTSTTRRMTKDDKAKVTESQRLGRNPECQHLRPSHDFRGACEKIDSYENTNTSANLENRLAIPTTEMPLPDRILRHDCVLRLNQG